jgi:hypothetical protein
VDHQPHDKFTNITIQSLANNLNNFNVQQSLHAKVPVFLAHKIAQTIAENNSEIKQIKHRRLKIINGLYFRTMHNRQPILIQKSPDIYWTLAEIR